MAVAKTMLRFTWGYRVELLLFALFVAIMWVAKSAPWWASASAFLFVVGLLSDPVKGEWFKYGKVISRFLRRTVSDANVRRQVTRAARDSGFPGLSVEKVSSTLPGEIIDVRVPRGQTVDKLDATARPIAACLRVADVRVIHDREDRSHAQLSIIRRDVFSTMGATPWPLIDADEVDIRQGIPFGLDEYGRVVWARLLSRNLLLGGNPDAGKSAALRVFAAAAALDPKVKLWMMDAKTDGAEFVHWAPAADGLVRGRKVEEAAEILAKLEERIEKRGREIVARGEVFVQPDMEIDVLMIDELPQFLRPRESDSKAEEAAVKAIRNHIWKIIAVGRWTGMVSILSAQKPTTDVVPSESRDLIDDRFALHCKTKAASKAILGGEDGEDPADASDIPSGQPGVGYYVSDDGVQKMRAFFISHKQAMEIASRVGSRQIDLELRAMS